MEDIADWKNDRPEVPVIEMSKEKKLKVEKIEIDPRKVVKEVFVYQIQRLCRSIYIQPVNGEDVDSLIRELSRRVDDYLYHSAHNFDEMVDK